MQEECYGKKEEVIAAKRIKKSHLSQAFKNIRAK